MKLVDKPCMNCKDRHEKCHATCERYIAAKKKHETAKTERIKELDYIGYVANASRKAKKSKGRRK